MERDSVLKAVRQSWGALRDADEVWKSDHEVVLTAVQHDRTALRFAAEALKGIASEVVLAAVRQHGGGSRSGVAASAEAWDCPPVCLGGPEGWSR
eukprot:243563-Amphidinium_carterae.1